MQRTTADCSGGGNGDDRPECRRAWHRRGDRRWLRRGTIAAKALDEFADVTLVEPRDAFVHNVAALRALVDPDWLPRIFFPYDRLLANGRVVRDRAVGVEGPGGSPTASGAELTPDFIVLATGSTYPYPAKSGTDETATALTRYAESHDELAQADRVLIVGAGPTGLELAGEIGDRWPEKEITILEPEPEILAGPSGGASGRGAPSARGARRRVRPRGCAHRGAREAAGHVGPGRGSTKAGRTIEADIWFRCYGLAPVSDYLRGDLEEHAARRRVDRGDGGATGEGAVERVRARDAPRPTSRRRGGQVARPRSSSPISVR